MNSSVKKQSVLNDGNKSINRLMSKLKRLEAEAKQAKEKLREQESEQAKILRLQKRRRVEHEQRLLGQVAYAAGLAEIRIPVFTKEGKRLMVIDADLVAGALDLLASQMNPAQREKRAGQQELDDLREIGRRIRRAYQENPENPKFKIPQVGVVNINPAIK